MKRSSVVFGVMGLALMMFPVLGFANEAPPRPEPRPAPNSPVPFKISSNNRTTQSKLIVPRKFMENSKTAGVFGTSDVGTNIRTVIAGIAISVSLAALVFLLIRKKSRTAQAMALFVALGSGGLLWVEQAKADLPPPTYDVVRDWGRVAKGQQNVIIEITDKGDSVELILGTKYQGSGGKRPKPQEPPKEALIPPKANSKGEAAQEPK